MLWKWCKKEVVSDGSGRYVRLRATDVGYRTDYPHYWHLTEVELFASTDHSGSDLTTGKTATAKSSQGGYGPDRAIDDAYTVSDGWRSFSLDNSYQWIRIDLGSSQTVRSLSLDFYYQFGSCEGPKELVVEVSDDDSNWATIATLEPTNTGDKQYFDNLQ